MGPLGPLTITILKYVLMQHAPTDNILGVCQLMILMGL